MIARHRKIHLFDIDIPGKITFKESETLSPGEGPTVVDLSGYSLLQCVTACCSVLQCVAVCCGEGPTVVDLSGYSVVQFAAVCCAACTEQQSRPDREMDTSVGCLLWDVCFGMCVMGCVLWDVCFGKCGVECVLRAPKMQHLYVSLYVYICLFSNMYGSLFTCIWVSFHIYLRRMSPTDVCYVARDSPRMHLVPRLLFPEFPLLTYTVYIQNWALLQKWGPCACTDRALLHKWAPCTCQNRALSKKTRHCRSSTRLTTTPNLPNCFDRILGSFDRM